MLRRWCIPLAGAALVIGSAAATAPAAAALHAPHGAATGHLVRPTIHLIRPAAHGTGPMVSRIGATSSNWSGFAAHRATYKSVSATWVEPTGHCTGSQTWSSFWVGLDGFSSKTVEQTGSEVDCRGGSPKYYSWYEMFPAFPVNFSNTVKPGDHFFGSVTHGSGNSYTLVLKDTTQGWSHTIHKTLASAKNSSAEVIAEAPCCTASGGILPLTDFGTMHFTNSKVNGKPIGSTSPTKIVMANLSTGRPKDAVTGLSGGGNFAVTWKHST
jgi:hypothetical protein